MPTGLDRKRTCDLTFGGSGIESHQRTGPHNGIALGAIHSVRAVCLPASEGVGPRVRIRLPPAESPCSIRSPDFLLSELRATMPAKELGMGRGLDFLS